MATFDLTKIHKDSQGLYYSNDGTKLVNTVIKAHREIIYSDEGEQMTYVIEVFEDGCRIMRRTVSALDVNKIYKAMPFNVFDIYGEKIRKVVLEKIITESLNESKCREVCKLKTGFHMSDTDNLIHISERKTYGNV